MYCPLASFKETIFGINPSLFAVTHPRSSPGLSRQPKKMLKLGSWNRPKYEAKRRCRTGATGPQTHLFRLPQRQQMLIFLMQRKQSVRKLILSSHRRSPVVRCRFLSTALKPTILFKSIMQILKLKTNISPMQNNYCSQYNSDHPRWNMPPSQTIPSYTPCRHPSTVPP